MTEAGSLGAAFVARARRAPGAVALISATRALTYGELDAMSGRIARGLVLRGVRGGDRIGVGLGRSMERVAALLAILRVGGVIVPLDPAWRDAIAVDHVLDKIEECDGPYADPEVTADALALVLPTSGSTGRPKAVLLEHRALLWRLRGLAAALPYVADDVCCHRTPLTFIDAYAEIFGPLLAGVPAVILPEPLAIADLLAAIATHRVTRLLLVPSLLGLVLDACVALPPCVRLIATSGEALTEGLATRVHAASSATLVNIYGSTEVGGDATCAVIKANEPITVGTALAAVKLRIVDEELQVAGPTLARGYDGPPAETAARFVSEAGETWFRTGDRARQLADGRYVLAGRLDDQVKVHGVRVELGEVEAALLALPGVREAGAALHAGRIVAGVVGEGLTQAALAQLAVRDAARPSAIAILPALPLTHHGKRDRARLATAVVTATARAVAAPADPRVAQIATWFAALTGTPAGADDELVALGGDSLARLGLLVHLERAGWHLEHADLPAPLTPSRLAAALRERPASRPAPDPTSPFPVTDFQRVMVLETLANHGTPMWLEQLAFTIHIAVDPHRFAAAWRAEMAAEPALRTRFLVDRDVRQVVDVEAPFELAHVALPELDLAAYRQRVKAEEWTRISRAFDLRSGPLFEVCLLTGADRCDLVFTYHHAVLDGESARKVLRAVLARYAGQRVARSDESFRAVCERPPLAATALRARLAGYVAVPPAASPRATGVGDLTWRLFHRLLAIRAGLAARRVRRHAARLPLTHAAGVYAGGDVLSQPLPALFEPALVACARARGTTVAGLWATAFALHLARERQTHDVVFGVVVAGRDGRSADAVGMLANCLPLRVRLDPSASLDATVGSVTVALAEIDAAGRAPMLDLGLDPRVYLDTLLTIWRYPPGDPPALAIGSGRGLTLTAPHTALVVSPSELAVGARTFHRTDRVRRDVLALVDALLAAAPDAPLRLLLALGAHEGGLAIAQPAL